MTSAASLYEDLDSNSVYYDRHSGLNPDEYKDRLKISTTLYVGNLSFYTNEGQLLEFFSQCGQVVNLIMGLNKQQKTPCGFCFVEYATREESQQAVDCLNLQTVDGRQVRIDWDPGFRFGRQFGRGKTGAQVRDEINQDQPDKDRPLTRPAFQPSSYRRGGNRGGSYQSGGGFNSGNRGGGGYKRNREFEGADEMEFDENDRRRRQKRFEDQM